MIDIASGEVRDQEPKPEEPGKDAAAAALGQKGGRARAAAHAVALFVMYYNFVRIHASNGRWRYKASLRSWCLHRSVGSMGRKKGVRMSDEPKTTTGIKIAPGSSEQAPFVYFDGVATMGVNHGAVQIELGANVLVPDGPAVKTDVLITAHLRCSPNAAADLRQAIDKALEMLKLPANANEPVLKPN